MLLCIMLVLITDDNLKYLLCKAQDLIIFLLYWKDECSQGLYWNVDWC